MNRTRTQIRENNGGPSLTLLLEHFTTNEEKVVLLERVGGHYGVRWTSPGVDPLGPGVIKVAAKWAQAWREDPTTSKTAHGLVPGWAFSLLHHGDVVVLKRVGVPEGPLNAKRDVQSLNDFVVPGIAPAAQAGFIKVFAEVDWGNTALGPIADWDNHLRSHVRLCLMSPFPVLLVWGSEMTMLYNYRYSQVIAGKHPRILGMTYKAGWPEVWEQIESFVTKAYAGQGTHVESTLMFLKRDATSDHLEETYFGWSMIPLRSHEGTTMGIWIPNAEVSSSIISTRRLMTFADLSRNVSDASSHLKYWTLTWEALNRADIDLPSIAVYSNKLSDDEAMSDDHESKSDSASGTWTKAQEARFAQMRRRGVRSSSEESLARDDMRLATPRPANCLLPKSIPVLGCASTVVSNAARLLRDAMRRIQDGEEHVHFKEQDTGVLFPHGRSVWGDQLTNSVMFPIKTSADDPIEAIIIVALNPRLRVNKAYMRFLELLAGQIGAGLAIVELFAVKLAEAQYRAWLNEQQGKEIGKALDLRTEELLKAEGTFTRVAENLPCGLWIGDGNGNVVYTNDAWHRISGYPKDEPIANYGQTVAPDCFEECRAKMSTFWDDAGPDEIKDGIMRPAQESGGFMFRWQGQTEDGLERWCSNLATREVDPATGKVLKVVGILADMSQRKHAETLQSHRADDALHRKARLNRFVDLLSHELRNPMAAIQSCVQLINDRLQDITGAKEEAAATPGALAESLDELQTINFCLHHMHRLVDETLSLSKIEHDFRTLTIEPFQPEMLLRKTLRMYDSELRTKGIKTTINVGRAMSSSKGLWLLSDSSKVMQILINFLSNAIKFTSRSEKKHITVDIDLVTKRPHLRDLYSTPVSPPTDSMGLMAMNESQSYMSRVPSPIPGSPEEPDAVFLVISVKDTGVGLSLKQQAVLFRRFAQATPKTQASTIFLSTMYGGSGLGLYISRKVAEILGGGCGMESEEGKGSTFSFYIKSVICPSPDAAPSSVEPDFETMARKLAYPTPRPSEPTLDQAYSKDSPTGAIMSEVILEKSLAISTPTSAPLSRDSSSRFVVLLVEDNLINQKLLKKQLTRAGCIVHTADHGGHAITFLVKAHHEGVDVDACLMDVEMPEVNGLTASRRIRALEAERKLSPIRLPILGVTANARPEQIEQMIDAGMDSVLTKPFKIEGLMSRLHGMIATRRRNSQAF